MVPSRYLHQRGEGVPQDVSPQTHLEIEYQHGLTKVSEKEEATP